MQMVWHGKHQSCMQIPKLLTVNEFSDGGSTDGTLDPAFAGLLENFSLSIPK